MPVGISSLGSLGTREGVVDVLHVSVYRLDDLTRMYLIQVVETGGGACAH